MVEFSIDQVKKVAKLARIRVTSEEVDKFSNDISLILSEIEKLEKCNTTGIDPLSNVTEGAMKMRKDQVTDGNILSQVLSNAKNSEFSCYVVPKVIE